VGDSITVNDTQGTVEGLNLRTTRVRALDGVVWYVPNGEIRKVGNSSMGYSCAVVDLLVPPGTDLARAGEVTLAEARELVGEDQWRDIVTDEPVYQGVQNVTVDGATLRLMVRTAPGEHLRLARTLRARVYDRFRREGVAWVPAGAAS
jgi:small conductance mechanosensitive channel